MLLRIFALLFLTVLARGADAADLKLIPYPRSVQTRAGRLTLASPAPLVCLPFDAEDRFAVDLLRNEIRGMVGQGVTESVAHNGKPSIIIGRAGEESIDAIIAERGLDTTALDNPEGYLLDISAEGALVAAKTAAGLFYGIQTLRQLVREDPAGGIVLPLVSIADWPAYRHRGVMIDVSQGAVMSPKMLRKAVSICAEYKINLINLYVEHVFPYDHSPLTAAGAALGWDEMRRLVAHARKHHVEVVPQQQMFGHLHSLLRWELYQHMAETPRGDVLVPGEPDTYEWIRKSGEQLAEVFPSQYLHIGSDETFELGEGRSKQIVAERGMSAVYVDHLRKMSETLKPLGKRLMFWGDIVHKNPEAISELPRDMVVTAWDYGAQPSFIDQMKPFRDIGMEVWISPGVANWRRIFPSVQQAVDNLNQFCLDGEKLGATGVLNTYWNDCGDELFNLTWHGIVFGGAASWQSGKVDVQHFDKSFDWCFYRNEGDAFIKIIRRMDSINHLIRSTGLHERDLTIPWFDTFSEFGAKKLNTLLPIAPEMRKRAEQCLVDLHFHSGEARLHEFTVPFLEFAARRMDMFGMKLLHSKNIADRYRDSLANVTDGNRVRRNLREISARSGVGRIHDIMDATTELKVMLRDLWRTENRPYYLENMMIRYDTEIQLWQQRKWIFWNLSRSFNSKDGLPGAEDLGLVLP